MRGRGSTRSSRSTRRRWRRPMRSTPSAGGKVRGPLHGIPVLLKDNIDVVGMANSAGSLALANHRPTSDAFLVGRLRAAGAVIVGKTNLSEWANFRSSRSTSGWSSRGGQTKNPYVLDRNPCGSSSGTGAAHRGKPGRDRRRHRNRRQHHLSRGGGWPGRPQADRGAGQPPRHHPDLGVAGHGRPDGANRRPMSRCCSERSPRSTIAIRRDRRHATTSQPTIWLRSTPAR